MNNETPKDLRTRTSDFALRIIKLYVKLPKTTCDLYIHCDKNQEKNEQKVRMKSGL